jgi:hypothetical protein
MRWGLSPGAVLFGSGWEVQGNAKHRKCNQGSAKHRIYIGYNVSEARGKWQDKISI